MKTIVVDTTEKTVTMVETETFEEALERAGLASGEVDWTGMGRTPDGRHITLMCYEWGLRKDEWKGRPMRYCRIGRQMYAGNLLIFAADDMGEDADMTDRELQILVKTLEWLEDKDACENAFAVGKMDRPNIAVNGEIIWQWNIDSAEKDTSKAES